MPQVIFLITTLWFNMHVHKQNQYWSLRDAFLDVSKMIITHLTMIYMLDLENFLEDVWASDINIGCMYAKDAFESPETRPNY